MGKIARKTVAAFSVPLVAAVIGVAAFFVIRYCLDNKAPGFGREYTLYVRPGMTVPEVLDSLCEGADAFREGSLLRCARKMDLQTNMKPGRYEIKPEFPPIYVMRMLAYCWQTPQNLVLSGTLRSKGRLASVISRQMMADSSRIADALEDDEFLSRYGFTSENVFAMILPDTYQMYWTATVEEIFDRFKKEYDIFWNEERTGAAREQGLTPMQVSILASIVSGETLKTFEYPKIAGVYLNRYRKGMKLQADPTVCFCYDYTLDRVLKKHLRIDSPYNTYKYAGLPPAPINVPPKACIDAVLEPDNHGYMFFCASPEFDGTHNFAVTYSEHLKNARAFQKALTARRKASAEHES